MRDKNELLKRREAQRIARIQKRKEEEEFWETD